MIKQLPIFLFCLMTLSAAGNVRQGRINLTKFDFSKQASLEGEWEFFWGQLLRPEQIQQTTNYIKFPGIWNNKIVGLDTLTPQGYATYRLLIDLPSEKRNYGIFLEDVYCNYQLFVNGVLVASNGKTGISKNESLPEWRPQVADLGELSRQVELVLQVSNFHHSKGGISDQFYFGDYQVLKDHYLVKSILDLFLAALLVFSAFYFFIRFGFFTLDMASLYFALFCLSYTYRIVGADYYVLHSYFPNFPWWIAIRMEYITLFLSVLFYCLYLDAMFEVKKIKWFIKVVVAICASYSLLVVLTDPIFFTQLIEMFFVFLIICFFVAFNLYINAVVDEKPGAWWGIASAAVIFTIFSYQIFVYFSWLPYFDIFILTGVIIFLILQFIQLHMYTQSLDIIESIISEET